MLREAVHEEQGTKTTNAFTPERCPKPTIYCQPTEPLWETIKYVLGTSSAQQMETAYVLFPFSTPVKADFVCQRYQRHRGKVTQLYKSGKSITCSTATVNTAAVS